MLDFINFGNVPQSLQDRHQWILWRLAYREGKPTKLPLQSDGRAAKSNDPENWTDFATVQQAFLAGGFSGPGFVFAADDPFFGIDLDGCRDPETGKVEEWARKIILAFGTYAEVSPSRSGVKLFCRGEPPLHGGKKNVLRDMPPVGGKQPAIEVYSRLRYFAVTGWRLHGMSPEPIDNPAAVQSLKNLYFADEPAASGPQIDWRSDQAVIERARKYVARMPPAITGQDGHGRTFHAACVLVLGFALPESDALMLLGEYNQGCQPPWSDKELEHKIKQAAKQGGQRGYLRDAAPERWGQIPVPQYQEPAESVQRTTTLVDAAKCYLDSIRNGNTGIITSGIPGDLDYALGGGFEPGEMVILAARPSHGKSCAALQCCHQWTEDGLPCVIVSEEMSARMLGRRTLQFWSKIPQEHWNERIADLDNDVVEYEKWHKPCVVVEGCGRVDVAAKAIEDAVRYHGAKCAVVDYAQLLGASGRTRYEQITQVSIVLRKLASALKIILVVVCQLNRGIEARGGDFAPVMSDLKDTGQLEQDADVIIMQCWPHRMNAEEPVGKYQFFVVKNRNRAINQSLVVCQFLPDRQMFLDAPRADQADVFHPMSEKRKHGMADRQPGEDDE